MKDEKNIKVGSWEKIARLIFNSEKELNESDVGQIEGLLVEEKRELLNSMKFTSKVDVVLQQNKYSKKEAWEKIQGIVHQNKTRKFVFGRIIKIAALVVFALLLGGFGMYYFNSETFLKNRIVAQQEVISSYTLPDGSVVSVNAGSKLYFPKKFEGNTREVIIEGEAFFDVKPNVQKPFLIKAGDAHIKVLGTSFNVDAYPGADKVEVVVKTGKVKILYQKDKMGKAEELLLDPGDKGTLLYSEKSLVKTSNNDENFLSWKTRVLVFRQTSLNEVIKKIEKVYGVKIGIADKELNKLFLTAEYRNYSIEDVMNLVSSTLDVKVEKIGNDKFMLKKRS